MRHARSDYAPIQDPRNLIPEDEPVFLLRGQDVFAYLTVEAYADILQNHGTDRAFVAAVRGQAHRMADWSTHKVPDAPKGALVAPEDVVGLALPRLELQQDPTPEPNLDGLKDPPFLTPEQSQRVAAAVESAQAAAIPVTVAMPESAIEPVKDPIDFACKVDYTPEEIAEGIIEQTAFLKDIEDQLLTGPEATEAREKELKMPALDADGRVIASPAADLDQDERQERARLDALAAAEQWQEGEEEVDPLDELLDFSEPTSPASKE